MDNKLEPEYFFKTIIDLQVRVLRRVAHRISTGATPEQAFRDVADKLVIAQRRAARRYSPKWIGAPDITKLNDEIDKP